MWARAAWAALLHKYRFRFFADLTVCFAQFRPIAFFIGVTFVIGAIPVSTETVSGGENAFVVTAYSNAIAKLGDVRLGSLETVPIPYGPGDISPQFTAGHFLNMAEWNSGASNWNGYLRSQESWNASAAIQLNGRINERNIWQLQSPIIAGQWSFSKGCKDDQISCRSIPTIFDGWLKQPMNDLLSNISLWSDLKFEWDNEGALDGGKRLASGFVGPLQGEILSGTNPNGYEGKERNPVCGTGRSAGSPIGGGFLILFGAALLKMAFYILDGLREPGWLRRLAWLIDIGSTFLIYQGTILSLTGNWLP